MRSSKWKWRAVMLALLFFAWLMREDRSIVGVGVNGVNHMQNGNAIAQFYINGGAYGNVGEGGGGGSHVCCVMLPEVWRPGLQIELKWELIDESVKKQVPYRAHVPVEKYDEVGDLVIHFFRNNKVRVVSSAYDVMSPNHPVGWSALEGGALATEGIKIPVIFSEEELAKLVERDRPSAGWRWLGY